MVYAIDSESNRLRHINWRNGVRIGPVDRDVLVGFIPPWESDSRPNHGVTGEGVGVDEDGNVYVAEGPSSLSDAGSAFTKSRCRRGSRLAARPGTPPGGLRTPTRSCRASE